MPPSNGGRTSRPKGQKPRDQDTGNDPDGNATNGTGVVLQINDLIQPQVHNVNRLIMHPRGQSPGVQSEQLSQWRVPSIASLQWL
jgi:hypothetical protein